MEAHCKIFMPPNRFHCSYGDDNDAIKTLQCENELLTKTADRQTL